MADGRTARPGHVTPGARPLRRLRPLPPPSPHPPPSHTAHAHTRARAPRPPLPFYTLLSRSSLLPTPPPPPRRAARAFQGNRKWRAGEGRAGGTIENKERRFGAAAREASPRLGPALPRIPGVPRCSSSAAAAGGGGERPRWRGVVRPPPPPPPRRRGPGCPRSRRLRPRWPAWGGGHACALGTALLRPPSPPAPGDIEVPPRRRPLAKAADGRGCVFSEWLSNSLTASLPLLEEPEAGPRGFQPSRGWEVCSTSTPGLVFLMSSRPCIK